MAWSDEPTDAQLAALANLIKWQVPYKTVAMAIDYLSERATRQELSYELKRLRELYIDHKLTREECFNSELWEDFDYD